LGAAAAKSVQAVSGNRVRMSACRGLGQEATLDMACNFMPSSSLCHGILAPPGSLLLKLRGDPRRAVSLAALAVHNANLLRQLLVPLPQRAGPPLA